MWDEEEGVKENSKCLFTGSICFFSVPVASSVLAATDGLPNTLPGGRDFLTLAHRLHEQNLSKALMGFSLPHNSLMSWLTSSSFHSSLLCFPGGKTHTLVPGRQPLSFEQSSVENWQDDTKLAFFCNVIGISAFQLWIYEHFRHWYLLSIRPPCLFSSSCVSLWGGGQAYLPWEMPIWERDPAFPFSRWPWSLCVILLEIPSLGFGDEKASLSYTLASPCWHPHFLWIYHFSQFFNRMERGIGWLSWITGMMNLLLVSLGQGLVPVVF